MPSAPRTAADHPQPLSWNAAAWFGSLFGCTLWMLALAGLAYGREPASALIPSIAFALAAGLGGLLWSRRATLRAHTALQVQLAVTGLLAFAAIASVDRQLDLTTFEGVWGGGQAYIALLVYPVLMVAF